jgi:hypothetical protein
LTRLLAVTEHPSDAERASKLTDLTDLESTLRERLDAIGPAPRAVLLHVLMLPDLERVRSIGEFHGDPRTRTFAQLLVDLEESPHARAVVLGELRERELRGRD